MNTTDYSAIIKETQDLMIKEKADWQVRYNEYAKQISRNLGSIKNKRRIFREWKPFTLYLNTTNAKNATNKAKFDLRYLGQSVAYIVCDDENVFLSTNIGKDKFEYPDDLINVPWKSKAAKQFRKHFKDRSKWEFNNKGNEEHRIESLLLSEFSKQKDKSLPNIKPVKIAGIRFPMPTPLRASDHDDVKYAKQYGGGIDILARTGTGGQNTNLCIIEVKDENINREPASYAIKQAIKYTVFIRELLRSNAGDTWWKLLGFGGAIPKNLVLYAACAMPYINNADTSFSGFDIKCNELGDDIIRLHYIYFKESDNKISKIYTSLPNKLQQEQSL